MSVLPRSVQTMSFEEMNAELRHLLADKMYQRALIETINEEIAQLYDRQLDELSVEGVAAELEHLRCERKDAQTIVEIYTDRIADLRYGMRHLSQGGS